MRKFNINGTCFPNLHYMVDIGERLKRVKSLVDGGAYFCINRGRQYGTTTTLEALAGYLKDDYAVFQISLEGVGDAAFENDVAMVRTFAGKLRELVEDRLVDDAGGVISGLANALKESPLAEADAMAECASFVGKLARGMKKPIVLLIDEVDQAGSHDSFIHFLSLSGDSPQS